MADQDSESTGNIIVEPNLIRAYLINMGKAMLFVAAIAGAVFLVQYLAGTNPFADILKTLGIPIVWVTRAIIAIIAIFFIITFFSTLSLTTYSLEFGADELKYSYGSFFKVSKSTPLSNVLRVNFRKYPLSHMGDFLVELTGTEERTLKVEYVCDVERQCLLANQLINRLINVKMSKQEDKDE